MRRWSFIVIFVLGVLWFRQNSLAPLATSTPTRQLEVQFIDVGQGDSIFLRTPDGVTALIDGGPTKGDVLSYLQRQGVRKLDLVIITHPHQDHIGGLVSVLETLDIGSVWTSGSSNTTRSYERILDIIAARRIPYHEVQTSQTIPFGELSFSVLYGVSNAANLNNTSLVLRLAYGETSFLFMGDAEKPVENSLLSTSAALLPSDVIKIGHHGSKTSSSPEFVKAVSPVVGVYSAGKDNYYDHPNQITLNTFAALNIPVYGTDKLGSIVVFSDGHQLRITNR